MIGIPLLLRAEWLALAIIGVAGYVWMGGALLWLLPLLLAPDLSAIGYLAGPRIGAMTYNAVHNLVLAFGLFGIGLAVRVGAARAGGRDPCRPRRHGPRARLRPQARQADSATPTWGTSAASPSNAWVLGQKGQFSGAQTQHRLPSRLAAELDGCALGANWPLVFVPESSEGKYSCPTVPLRPWSGRSSSPPCP